MTRLPELPSTINDPSVANLLRGLIPVRDLPEILPLGRNGTKLAMSTVWRWRRKGRRGRKLPVITIRGVGYVRAEDLVAFLAPEAQEQARPAEQAAARPTGRDDYRHEAVEGVLAQEFGV
jgi:hypothetical protein